MCLKLKYGIKSGRCSCVQPQTVYEAMGFSWRRCFVSRVRFHAFAVVIRFVNLMLCVVIGDLLFGFGVCWCDWFTQNICVLDILGVGSALLCGFQFFHLFDRHQPCLLNLMLVCHLGGAWDLVQLTLVHKQRMTL